MKKQQQKTREEMSKAYFEALGQQESSSNYKAVNRAGYLGKYQMGEAAMVDVGYYKPKIEYNNKWDGQFTGKNGVYSKADFLNNPQAQEQAVRDYSKAIWNQVSNTVTKYDGEMINGIPLTQSGMLAGGHLVGPGGLRQYINSNGKIIPKDGDGVSIETYIKKFGGYPVLDITKTPSKPSKHEIYNKILNPIPFSAPNSPGFPTGYASDINSNHVQSNLSGYVNPLTGNNRIFTREEIGAMSKDEFAKYEKEIDAQVQAMGGRMPTNAEMAERATVGGVVYVHPYTRSDGTEVKGYYRSR